MRGHQRAWVYAALLLTLGCHGIGRPTDDWPDGGPPDAGPTTDQGTPTDAGVPTDAGPPFDAATCDTTPRDIGVLPDIGTEICVTSESRWPFMFGGLCDWVGLRADDRCAQYTVPAVEPRFECPEQAAGSECLMLIPGSLFRPEDHAAVCAVAALHPDATWYCVVGE